MSSIRSRWISAAGALAFITGISTVIMGTLPLLNGLFAERLHLNWQELGWLGAVAQMGTLAGTLLAYQFIRRDAIRLGIRLGAACSVLAWLLAATAETFESLLTWRSVAAAGVGCVFAIGTCALARDAVPAKSFSIMSGVQVVCGSVHSAALPWLQHRFGDTIALASIVLWFVLIISFAQNIAEGDVPADEPGRTESVGDARPRVRYSSIGLLASILFFQTAAVTFWAYSERIAAASGLAGGQIGAAVALGNLGGVPASILGALVGERLGYLPILVLATIAVVSGELAMIQAATFGPYLVGQVLFNFGWILGLSFYLGLLAKRSGKTLLMTFAPIVLVIAAAAGSLWVAVFFRGNNSSALLAMSLVLACLAITPVLIRRS